MAIDNKYHIKIGDFGFILGRDVRLNRHLYARDEAPAFVNKFSSGEPNYRDASFFSHWVSLDFLNGLGQEFFDDPSRFFYSEGLDTTQIQQLTLERMFSSAGQLAAGIYGKTQLAWREVQETYYGDGSDGDLTIGSNTTDAPIDSACSGSQGSTTLSATNASFAAGQKILIHQTRGTNAGTWQRTEIQSYSAGTIITKDPLSIAYDSTGNNKAQVLVLKQYDEVTISSGFTLKAKAWNGTVGGILAFLVKTSLTVNGTMSANGGAASGDTAGSDGGFRGSTVTATQPGFAGEGSVGPATNSSSANGNGGGGRPSGTSNGAGGGGHAAAGTQGEGSGGAGGSAVGVAALTTLFFGGAGGSAYNSGNGAGGNGGGIIFIIAKTMTVDNSTGNIVANGGNGGNGSTVGGGGGAGGSILMKVQTATLNTTRVTATGGTGGTGSGNDGGAGSVGRIHIDYLTSFTGTSNPTIDSLQDGTLTTSQFGTTITQMVGASDGGIYSWNGSDTYTELFNARRVEWFDDVSVGDTDHFIGDDNGTEHANAQSFEVDANMYVKAVQIYIKVNEGTPSDLVVRIETNSTTVPSGTLVDAANAQVTVPVANVPSGSYGWLTVELPAAISLAAATKYWIVLKAAAAGNDNNYTWRTDDSSPGYTAGNMASSTDGGSTWSAQSGRDGLFRLLGNATSVNCSVLSDLSGGTKAYFGTGDPAGTKNGDARLYSYDGTTFALVKTFNTTNESSILSMIAFGKTTPSVFFGLGHKAKIYSTTNFSSYTLSKTITEPRNPGYVLTMANYGETLFVGGGYPEQLYGSNYQYSGFLYSYDEFDWSQVGTFEHTVITCLETFDTLLFIGTIKKRLYVFNTATIDKLFEFKQDVQMTSMVKWDDKLAIAISPRPGASLSGHEGIYLFDKNGLHKAFYVANRSWYSLFVYNNNIMAANDDGHMFQSSFSLYGATGWLQTSYFEAQLPSIDKLFRELIIQMEALPSGCSITVEYRFSEAESWTTLGTADTDGDTQETFTFPVATYAKRMTLKITLATSNSANTPTLKKIITKYQLAPDLKYIWKMTLVCPDNMKWLDDSEPTSPMTNGCTANDTTLLLDDADGMPDPNGATFYASVIDDTGAVIDTFTYTEISGNTLTGIPSSGAYALGTHAAGTMIAVMGRDLHKNLLELKRTKKFFTFTDIDGNTYTTYFHSFQTDGWAIDVSEGKDVLENEVPITILEA